MGVVNDELQHGVRFDFELQPGESAERAVYAVRVRAPGHDANVTVEITATSAVLTAGADDPHAVQLIALAKTLGKRAADEGWPRRIARWRSPGVR